MQQNKRIFSQLKRFGYVNHVITIRELIDTTQDMFSSTLSVPFDD